MAHNLNPKLKFIVITGNPDSPLAQESDVCLSTGSPKEVCILGMTPTTSTTVMTVIGDILVVQTMQKTGFTIEDYSKTSPRRLPRRKIKSVMRKVIGIGETILDIIFRNEQPSAAVPGGSVFNGIVSLSRTGVPVCFISETGNDHVAISSSGSCVTIISLRTTSTYFLTGNRPFRLPFWMTTAMPNISSTRIIQTRRLDVDIPKTGKEDDIVVIGSYYALNPVLREKVLELLDQAREKKAIVYYDPNFRSSHKEEP